MNRFLSTAILIIALTIIGIAGETAAVDITLSMEGPATITRNGIVFHYNTYDLTPNDPAPATVVAHVDGDTFKVLLDGEKETLRLAGIDTPETKHPSKPVQYYGPQASAFTKAMCPIGSKVYLTFESDKRGYYGRLLTYVWYKSDDGEWILHNYAVVENGFSDFYDKYKFKEEYMNLFWYANKIAKCYRLGMFQE